MGWLGGFASRSRGFDEVCPGAVDDASRAERLFDSEAMTEQRRAAEALWLELEACQAAVSACYPSAEQLREEAAEASRKRMFGGPFCSNHRLPQFALVASHIKDSVQKWRNTATTGTLGARTFPWPHLPTTPLADFTGFS